MQQKILHQHPIIDLALFEVGGIDVEDGLEIGDSDSLNLNDHIAVAGFPNHNFGDSGSPLYIIPKSYIYKVIILPIFPCIYR